LVESKQKLNFPDSGSSTGAGGGGGVDDTSAVASSGAASNNIGPQLQGIVSQLANGIDSTKDSDRLYMIGMSGVGAGVAGIVIAAVALSRKEILKIS
jgi:hypothetical protein